MTMAFQGTRITPTITRGNIIITITTHARPITTTILTTTAGATVPTPTIITPNNNTTIPPPITDAQCLVCRRLTTTCRLSTNRSIAEAVATAVGEEVVVEEAVAAEVVARVMVITTTSTEPAEEIPRR